MAVNAKHCAYCFDVLIHHLNPDQDTPAPKPHFPDAEYPLFVTWNTVRSSGELRLRGCIGTFTAQPIQEGLKEFALTSALRDSRFAAITRREVPKLSCSVSLLTNFEKVTNVMDWEIGVHGVWIEFQDTYGHRRTATYLPEIAAEQGWSKIETLDSLLRKGGYTGRITDAVRYAIKVTRYRSEKASLSYPEYLKLHSEA